MSQAEYNSISFEMTKWGTFTRSSRTILVDHVSEIKRLREEIDTFEGIVARNCERLEMMNGNLPTRERARLEQSARANENRADTLHRAVATRQADFRQDQYTFRDNARHFDHWLNQFVTKFPTRPWPYVPGADWNDWKVMSIDNLG